MKITTNQILKITEEAIDKIGAVVDRSFTESEEAWLAVDMCAWCRQQGIEVVDEEEAG